MNKAFTFMAEIVKYSLNLAAKMQGQNQLRIL